MMAVRFVLVVLAGAACILLGAHVLEVPAGLHWFRWAIGLLLMNVGYAIWSRA